MITSYKLSRFFEGDILTISARTDDHHSQIKTAEGVASFFEINDCHELITLDNQVVEEDVAVN